MDHHPNFEHGWFLGDKRTQLVCDLDTWDDEAIINKVAQTSAALCFGPNTLAEALRLGFPIASLDARRSTRVALPVRRPVARVRQRVVRRWPSQRSGSYSSMEVRSLPTPPLPRCRTQVSCASGLDLNGWSVR